MKRGLSPLTNWFDSSSCRCKRLLLTFWRGSSETDEEPLQGEIGRGRANTRVLRRWFDSISLHQFRFVSISYEAKYAPKGRRMWMDALLIPDGKWTSAPHRSIYFYSIAAVTQW